MSKKHCKMICVYRIKDNYYEIRNVLLITRQGNIHTLIDEYTNTHLDHYINRRDIVKTCIALARNNGSYEVDHWHDFGVEWYDVNLIDSRTGSIGRIALDE